MTDDGFLQIANAKATKMQNGYSVSMPYQYETHKGETGTAIVDRFIPDSQIRVDDALGDVFVDAERIAYIEHSVGNMKHYKLVGIAIVKDDDDGEG